jgi:site-specific DNA recombinase
MPEPIRAVAYYRKSNDDDGNSVEQQSEWGRLAATREGVQIVREFTDQSKAGWDTAKRTAFHDMLKFCQEQKRRGEPIDAILCWNANRFSRADSQETAWFVWEFRRCGTGLMLTASRWIDFARMEDRVLFNIEQDTSHHPYVINLARDSTRGMIKAAREGRYLGGPVPYGYRLALDPGGKKRLVPGPAHEVEAIGLIFRTYAETALGLRSVAVLLTRRGVPSPGGKSPWNLNTIRNILTHPAYLGRSVWNRKREGQFFGVVECKPAVRQAGEKGKAPNPRESWVWGEGRHEPLIDVETFERCAAKLASRRGGRGPAARGQYLLSGLVRCGHCGRAMVGRAYRPGASRVQAIRAYLCSGYNLYGKAVCLHHEVDADALGKAVLAKLEAQAADFLAPGNVEALRAEIARQDAAESGQATGDEKRLRVRLADLERKVQQAADRVLDEENESIVPELRARLLARKQERDAAQAQLAAMEAKPATAADHGAGVDAAIAMMTRLVGCVRSEDAAELQAVLREWVSYVEVWFRQVPHKRGPRNHFARGLVFVREDVRLTTFAYSAPGRS